MMESDHLLSLINSWLDEDTGDGDHSSVACIPEKKQGKARLLVKQRGIIAGIRVAGLVFSQTDSSLKTGASLNDGDVVSPGDVAFYVTGNMRAILRAERLVLNIMQRMSGIATVTKAYVDQLKGLKTIVLDTRKTSPGLRILEKEAVRLGGAQNHRMGLYDMIMLKDNHIDTAGGIRAALQSTRNYLEKSGRSLRVEIEARNLDDVREIIDAGGADRIMLDNFSLRDTLEAVRMIDKRYETESSGGITLDNIRMYAECGVDYISVGALTHQIKSLDMSLKAVT